MDKGLATFISPRPSADRWKNDAVPGYISKTNRFTVSPLAPSAPVGLFRLGRAHRGVDVHPALDLLKLESIGSPKGIEWKIFRFRGLSFFVTDSSSRTS